ncbi:MAG: type II secretion system F family protein [Stackebrandtia sp.]
MIAAAIAMGAICGTGIVLIVKHWRPPIPDLATEVDTYAPLAAARQPQPTTPRRAWSQRASDTVHRWGVVPQQLRDDLAAVDTPVSAFIAQLAKHASIAASAALMAHVAAQATGTGPRMPLWILPAAVALAVWLNVRSVAERAKQARTCYRRALSLYVDLVVIALAGGAGIDEALGNAADQSDTREFAAIGACLETAAIQRRSCWDTLAELGSRIGVTEYSQLAATVGLAGSEGAKIRESLTARAQTMRTRHLTDTRADAEAATERTSLPTVGLLAAFLLLLGYPAMTAIVVGL